MHTKASVTPVTLRFTCKQLMATLMFVLLLSFVSSRDISLSCPCFRRDKITRRNTFTTSILIYSLNYNLLEIHSNISILLSRFKYDCMKPNLTRQHLRVSAFVLCIQINFERLLSESFTCNYLFSLPFLLD